MVILKLVIVVIIIETSVILGIKPLTPIELVLANAILGGVPVAIPMFALLISKLTNIPLNAIGESKNRIGGLLYNMYLLHWLSFASIPVMLMGFVMSGVWWGYINFPD